MEATGNRTAERRSHPLYPRLERQRPSTFWKWTTQGPSQGCERSCVVEEAGAGALDFLNFFVSWCNLLAWCIVLRARHRAPCSALLSWPRRSLRLPSPSCQGHQGSGERLSGRG